MSFIIFCTDMLIGLWSIYQERTYVVNGIHVQKVMLYVVISIITVCEKFKYLRD